MAAPTTPILDTLQENNSASPPSARWALANISGSNNFIAASATGSHGNGGAGGDYDTTLGSLSGDVEAYVSAPVNSTTNGDYFAVIVRWTNASGHGYRIGCQREATNDNIFIQRFDGPATVVNLLAPTAITGHSAGVWATVIGTVITGYYWNGSAWVSGGTYDISGDATKYTSGNHGILTNDSTWVLSNYGGGNPIPFTPKPLSYYVQ